MNRLTSVSEGSGGTVDWSQSYSYVGNGNRWVSANTEQCGESFFAAADGDTGNAGTASAYTSSPVPNRINTWSYDNDGNSPDDTDRDESDCVPEFPLRCGEPDGGDDDCVERDDNGQLYVRCVRTERAAEQEHVLRLRCIRESGGGVGSGGGDAVPCEAADVRPTRPKCE
jgi:hypothetical protein